MADGHLAALLREFAYCLARFGLEPPARTGSERALAVSSRFPAQAVVDSFERLKQFALQPTVHHKTRTKLLAALHRVEPVVQMAALIALPMLPEAFDADLFQAAARQLSRDFADELRPLVKYYERRAGDRPDDNGVRFSRRGVAAQIAQPEIDDDFEPEDGSSRDAFELALAHGSPSSAPDVVPARAPRVPVGATEVAVYYGTTREEDKAWEGDPERRYLDGRGSGELSLGRAVVSIPKGHRIGTLERPFKLLAIRLKPNPVKHVMVQSVVPMTAGDWADGVREELTRRGKRNALVFIHGFNVTFAQAMLRAAQIAKDISYEGVATAFSWGSQGTVAGYPADEDTVALSVPHLTAFLDKLRRDAGVEEFHLLAHSMGCRALLGALNDTRWWGTTTSPVTEAIFAAPDVDATVYKQTINAMPDRAHRYTLYGSERDWALAISRSVRKNFPRAGDGGPNVLVMQGVQTVDVTQVGEHLFGLGHSYVVDKRSILGDLWGVIRGHAMPRFGLEAKAHADGTYWWYAP